MRVRRVWIVAAIAVIATTPWWGPLVLGRFRFFEVRRIEVVGARYLTPATITAALGLPSGASVWSDESAMERRVRTLGGIVAVRVSRHLPSTLRVEVAEEEPVALAEGPSGLVPVGRDGKPLPYDPVVGPVDAPVVERAAAPLIAALATVQAADPALYGDVSAARAGGGGGDVVLDLESGRLVLATPVDPAVVHAMAAVREDLRTRGEAWRELDGRFGGWVVARGVVRGGVRPAGRGAPRTKAA